MIPKTIKPAEIISLLEQSGFTRISQNGSHVKTRNKEKVTVIIPVHQNKELKKGLAMAILRQAGIY